MRAHNHIDVLCLFEDGLVSSGINFRIIRIEDFRSKAKLSTVNASSDLVPSNFVRKTKASLVVKTSCPLTS